MYVLVSGDMGETGRHYDEDDEAGTSSSPPRNSYDPRLGRRIYGPKLTLSEYKYQLNESIDEYFLSGEQSEFLNCVKDLESPVFNFEIVKRLIIKSMDRTDRERELVSQVISASYPEPLNTNTIGKGFERLLESLDDLKLDVPDCGGKVATYLARAVVDEVLPPSFLTDQTVRALGGDVVKQARLLLEREHASSRMHKCWGPAGSKQSIAEIKAEMDMLLKEFLLSRDLEEAGRCVRELDCALYHHELVKRGVKTAMDALNPSPDIVQSQSVQDMATLFKYLHSTVALLSSQQVARGVARTEEALDDFVCDCPRAREVFGAFKQGFVKEGMLE
jgi:programmed cell death protein 4